VATLNIWFDGVDSLHMMTPGSLLSTWSMHKRSYTNPWETAETIAVACWQARGLVVYLVVSGICPCWYLSGGCDSWDKTHGILGELPRGCLSLFYFGLLCYRLVVCLLLVMVEAQQESRDELDGPLMLG
jgi:hypothetical protein